MSDIFFKLKLTDISVSILIVIYSGANYIIKFGYDMGVVPIACIVLFCKFLVIFHTF